jgi:AcrR family transcriptional regulator
MQPSALAAAKPATVDPRPDRVVTLAARWIHDGRRLDMQGLADELGMSRQTVFRRAGGRQELLSKALWVLTERTLVTAAMRWEAQRPDGELHAPGTGRHINALVSQSAGLRRLLDDEPALALKVLTDPHGLIQTGVVAFTEKLLRRDMAEFGLVPLTEPGALAYALVRLGESFLYADVLSARKPDVAMADRLQQALVEGFVPQYRAGHVTAGSPDSPPGPTPAGPGQPLSGPGQPLSGTGQPLSGTGQPLSGTGPSDGRAARSARSRRAIVDAMRALHAEGDLQPTARRIAERAGVSLRTVWQQFADMEALLVEAIRRDHEILLALIEPIAPDQPLGARVAQFVRQRSAILEQMSPSWRAARVQAPFSVHLRQDKAYTLSLAKAELDAVFAPELSQLAPDQRRELGERLHAVSVWAFWESLRTDLGLPPEQASHLLSTTFGALLADAGFPLSSRAGRIRTGGLRDPNAAR